MTDAKDHARADVAHLAVYGSAPRGREGLKIVRASGQILQAAVPPVIVLLLAVRRTQLPWWQQAIAVAGLVGVGLLVVGIKILAH